MKDFEIPLVEYELLGYSKLMFYYCQSFNRTIMSVYYRKPDSDFTYITSIDNLMRLYEIGWNIQNMKICHGNNVRGIGIVKPNIENNFYEFVNKVDKLYVKNEAKSKLLGTVEIPYNIISDSVRDYAKGEGYTQSGYIEYGYISKNRSVIVAPTNNIGEVIFAERCFEKITLAEEIPKTFKILRESKKEGVAAKVKLEGIVLSNRNNKIVLADNLYLDAVGVYYNKEKCKMLVVKEVLGSLRVFLIDLIEESSQCILRKENTKATRGKLNTLVKQYEMKKVY